MMMSAPPHLLPAPGPLPAAPATAEARRAAFWAHVGQTSSFEPSLDVAGAEGCELIDASGRRYLDLIAGIAVCNVGHAHPRVVAAAQAQVAAYAHTMVYGEHIQAPQVELACLLAHLAPAPLDCAYFLTTGAEANDAALKMAARLTGRRRFAAFKHAYHGDTVGALSCFGSDHFRHPFRRLLLDADFLPFDDKAALQAISEEHAAVIIEPVQGEAGIRVPHCEYLPALRRRCDATGTMLIFDEVQTAFGRCGDWFAARWFGVTPDVITLAKGLGAGMPLAAVLAPRERLHAFAAEPAFSHITTFGGHPVSCAAAVAGLRIIEEEGLLAAARERGAQLRAGLQTLAARCGSDTVREVRGLGLMLGLELRDEALARTVVNRMREIHGMIVETNLMAEHVVRLSPPLTISKAQCERALQALAECLHHP